MVLSIIFCAYRTLLYLRLDSLLTEKMSFYYHVRALYKFWYGSFIRYMISCSLNSKLILQNSELAIYLM